MNYTIAFLILIIAYFHTPISSLKAKMIFVSNEGSDTVTVIDSNKLEIIKTINTGGRPRDMRISPDKRFLYVATSEANHIEIIDLQSLSIIGTVETGDDPEIFAIDPENKIIVVSNEDDNEVTVIDINTKKIIRVVENVGIEPEGVTFSPDGKRVFVTSEGTNTVIIIDPWEGKIIDEILVGNRPRRGVFTTNGKEYWVSNELGGTVSIIDAKNLNIKKTLSFNIKGIRDNEITPVDFAVNPNGSHILVTLGRANHVAKVRTDNYEIEKYILAGKRVWGAAIDKENNNLFVTNGNSDDITIISLDKNTAIKSLPVGRTPHTVRILE